MFPIICGLWSLGAENTDTMLLTEKEMYPVLNLSAPHLHSSTFRILYISLFDVHFVSEGVLCFFHISSSYSVSWQLKGTVMSTAEHNTRLAMLQRELDKFNEDRKGNKEEEKKGNSSRQ